MSAMTPTPAPGMIDDAELHAFVDGQLDPARRAAVEAWLVANPEAAARAADYAALNEQLRAHFEPVLAEAPPTRLRAKAAPLARPRPAWSWAMAASLAGVLVLGGALGYGLRGAGPGETHLAIAPGTAAVPGFAERAVVAHTVFAPDQRRPVEVDGEHEEQLVRWLSKRLGAPMRAPQLQTLGYALEGGRLLPGGQGPVAQFMYRDSEGGRLTLYVSNEAQAGAAAAGGEFRYLEDGAVRSFYWVDGAFAYAITAGRDRADRRVLGDVAHEVYRQLTQPVAASAASS